jgi:hypothetical protein
MPNKYKPGIIINALYRKCPPRFYVKNLAGIFSEQGAVIKKINVQFPAHYCLQEQPIWRPVK